MIYNLSMKLLVGYEDRFDGEALILVAVQNVTGTPTSVHSDQPSLSIVW